MGYRWVLNGIKHSDGNPDASAGDPEGTDSGPGMIYPDTDGVGQHYAAVGGTMACRNPMVSEAPEKPMN